MLDLKGDVVQSVDFVRVPDKISEVKKCKREEFISLEDVAAITDKAVAYPSAENIDKIEVVYTSLPQNDNFTFSPLYQRTGNAGRAGEVRGRDLPRHQNRREQDSGNI